MILVEYESNEWLHMWTMLARVERTWLSLLYEVNSDDSDDRSSSIGWRYCGTELSNGRLLHRFRHDLHPVTQKEAVLLVRASEGFCGLNTAKKLIDQWLANL